MPRGRAPEILAYVQNHSGSTSTMIWRAVGGKLTTIHGILMKLTEAGAIERRFNVGPRGGYGFFALDHDEHRPDAWEHLLGD